MTTALAKVQQYFSHAFSPIFRYTPDHSIHDCPYCFNRVKHTSKIIQDHVPLTYQPKLQSTKLNRYSVTIGLLDQDKTLYDTMRDMLKNNFHCKVNRTLIRHLDFIPPTLQNIEAEFQALFSSAKINDHFIIYINGGISAQKWLQWCQQYLQPNTPLTLWIVNDSVFDPQYQLFQTEKDTQTLNELYTSARVRIHYLSYALSDQNLGKTNEFTKLFLHVLRQNDYRISLRQLLYKINQEAQNRLTARCWSNYPINPSKTYFSFG